MKLTLPLLFAVVLLTPSLAYAANLSIFPPSVVLKSGDSVNFTLQVHSLSDINTIGSAIVLPPDLTYLSVSDGTIVKQWVEKPAFHKDANTVSFSGIVPNGWSGDGTLAVIKVAARKEGTYSLNFDPSQTEIYKNDGNATPEPVVYGAPQTTFGTPTLYLGLVGILLIIVIVLMLFRRKYKILFI